MIDKYYSGLKAMLEHVGRRKKRSREQDFIAIKNEVERKVNRVNYDFARSSYELGIYMIRKLRGRAKVTAEGKIKQLSGTKCSDSCIRGMIA